MLRNRGDDVWCPLCDNRFRRFDSHWNRPDVRCWRCGSHERHRAQWLLLQSRPDLLERCRRLLHFAPEYCLRRQLKRAARRQGFAYVTADRDLADVDVRVDITALPLAGGAYDAVICSHVLEHVDDDAAAMRELRRVTAPGGWCLVMVPLDQHRAATHEDPAVVAPAQRQEAFRGPDHVRLYGRDVVERLTRAGFTVEVVRPDVFGEATMRRARLLSEDWMLLCR